MAGPKSERGPKMGAPGCLTNPLVSHLPPKIHGQRRRAIAPPGRRRNRNRQPGSAGVTVLFGPQTCCCATPTVEEPSGRIESRSSRRRVIEFAQTLGKPHGRVPRVVLPDAVFQRKADHCLRRVVAMSHSHSQGFGERPKSGGSFCKHAELILNPHCHPTHAPTEPLQHMTVHKACIFGGQALETLLPETRAPMNEYKWHMFFLVMTLLPLPDADDALAAPADARSADDAHAVHADAHANLPTLSTLSSNIRCPCRRTGCSCRPCRRNPCRSCHSWRCSCRPCLHNP